MKSRLLVLVKDTYQASRIRYHSLALSSWFLVLSLLLSNATCNKYFTSGTHRNNVTMHRAGCDTECIGQISDRRFSALCRRLSTEATQPFLTRGHFVHHSVRGHLMCFIDGPD